MERDRETMSGADEGWKEVTSKKKKSATKGEGKLDVATSVWKTPYKDTCSFYFSDFPEAHGAKEMLKAFKLYGEALEVVIPPKRDKRGRRFRFVRFSNVEDSRRFAIRLDNIIFGSTKIHANIPRFQRVKNDDDYNHNRAQHSRKATVQQNRQIRNHHSRQVKTEWRKKEAGATGERKMTGAVQHNTWRKGVNHNTESPNIVYHRKKNLAEICYSVGEEAMHKLRKMFVGTVSTPGSTYSVQEWFNMQGFLSIKVTPLGANKVLLEELEEGVIQELMKDYKEWMHEKFEGIKGWDPDVIDNERVVWVRCHGIPTHAWTDEFFASLARNFGEYLGVDEATRTKKAMDVARIRLRSNGYDVFNAEVTANINGSLFHIKMVEEWCGPLQWVENCCCQKQDHLGESSESDDDHDKEPPLFSVEDDCFSSFEEDGEGGERVYEDMEEGEVGYEEVSFVQETIEVHDEKRMENNYGEAEMQPEANVEGEKSRQKNEMNNGEIRGGNSNHEENGKVGCEVSKVNTFWDCGGPHVVERFDVEGDNVNDAVGGIRSEGGFEKEENIVSRTVDAEREESIAGGGDIRNGGGWKDQPSPNKAMKRKKKIGPETGKKKEKIKKKKGKETQQITNATPLREKSTETHGSCSTQRLGVVRNHLSLFQPSSSNSDASKAAAPASQVESIGDSGIAMGNIRFEKEMERAKAEKLWGLAKEKLGVSAVGNDEEVYIEKIRTMEERDAMLKGRKGKTQASK